MKMRNIQQFKNYAEKNAGKLGFKEEEITRYCLYEDVVLRISKSRYKHNFILKGSFVLSSIVGIEYRIPNQKEDVKKKDRKNGPDYVKSLLQEILDDTLGIKYKVEVGKIINNSESDLKYEIVIKAEDECSKNKNKMAISINVTETNNYRRKTNVIEHECLMTKEIINLEAYSIENILADKIATLNDEEKQEIILKELSDINIIEEYFSDNLNYEKINKKIKRLNKKKEKDLKKSTKKAIISDNIEAIENNKKLKRNWLKYNKISNNEIFEKEKKEFTNVVSSYAKFINDINENLEIAK